MAKPRRKRVSYTGEEIHAASNQVMKSLNGLNRQSSRSSMLSKPMIANNLGGRIDKAASKSSRRRQNRKERANLAGKPMDTLLETLPQIPSGPPKPQSVKQSAPLDPHKSLKARNKVEKSEIQHFKAVAGTSLDAIRQQLVQRSLEGK